jgi:hypothetical protein
MIRLFFGYVYFPVLDAKKRITAAIGRVHFLVVDTIGCAKLDGRSDFERRQESRMSPDRFSVLVVSAFAEFIDYIMQLVARIVSVRRSR